MTTWKVSRSAFGRRQTSFLMEVSAEVLPSIGLGLGKVAIANGPASKLPLADRA